MPKTIDDKVTKEKILRMLQDYKTCFESFEATGNGADCKKCCLEKEITLKINMSGEETDTPCFSYSETRIDVLPCLLLPEIASRIKVPKAKRNND